MHQPGSYPYAVMPAANKNEGRCNYEASSPWRDVVFAVLFVAQLFAVGTLTVVYRDQLLTQTKNPDGIRVTSSAVALVALMFAAAITFTFLWIQYLQKHSSEIIRQSMIVNIGVQVAVGVAALIIGQPMLALFMLISGGILAIWYYLVRGRIKFAGVMLELSSNVVNQNSALVWITIASQLVAAVWFGIWLVTCGAVLNDIQARQDTPSDQKDDGAALKLLVFGMLLSLVWTIETLRNLVHSATAGVCGSYYFFGNSRRSTLGAFRRSLTTTFGSICLGSLIVSVVSVLRMLVDSSRRQNEDNLAQACLSCILSCVESMIRYITKFAFTRVAIYGESFMQAAKGTYELFTARGLDVVIADDLSGFALLAGMFLVGSAAAVTGAGISAAMFGLSDGDQILGFGMISFGFGVAISAIMLSVITSGVATFIVCWAEDPSALARNHPVQYAKLHRVVQEQYPMFMQSPLGI